MAFNRETTRYVLNAIFTYCQQAEVKISDRGYHLPEVEFKINWIDREAEISVGYKRKPSGSFDNSSVNKYFYLKDFDIIEAIGQVDAYIEALPDPVEARRDDYRARVARMIDEGRELGIHADVMAQMEAAMKALSENAITHQPDAANDAKQPTSAA